MPIQYQPSDHSRKKYLEVLEQNAKDSPKNIPKNYERIKGVEEKIGFLEGILFKSFNKKVFYKIYKEKPEKNVNTLKRELFENHAYGERGKFN